MDLLAQDSSTSATISSTGEKVCGKCGETKHVTEFPISRNYGYKDGRENRCKGCCRAKWKAYRAKNLDKVKSMQRKWDTEELHYGSDEKFGETWRDLDAVLASITYMRVTPLQRAA